MAMRPSAPSTRERRGLRVRGTVQGVGFRPVVQRLATALSLDGLVRNDSDGVWIEIEGDPQVVARFAGELAGSAPPLSRIEATESFVLAPVGERGFRIDASQARAPAHTLVPPDAAPCADCLRELADPSDRRYRYPFINCTACGPRYTITRALPYDRARTTMAGFTMCDACRREYGDPSDRRFHAEPNACPACGPQLTLIIGGRSSAAGDAALAKAVRLIRAGGIVAVKGVGGYRLAADAENEAAIATLRERKLRPHKPLAILARDLTTASEVAEIGPVEARELESAARPIVLLRARANGKSLAPSVAPGMREVGVMLPSSPLDQLLTTDGPALLVMTSGNRADEAIAADEDEAGARLAGIADALLAHDRPIFARADDSVIRIVAGAPQPVRRARGYCPEAIALPFLDEQAPVVLAVGGQQKSTLCLTRGGAAHLSPHLGDLEQPSCVEQFHETIARLAGWLGVTPELVAHDLHPEYRSTLFALEGGLPRVGVQHHHAHVAACLAEHGRTGPVIGVAFDGTGCGPDGSLWGGELLSCDLGGFRRLAHLRPLPLYGGAAAIEQPWRLALAALRDAEEPLDVLSRIDPQRIARIAAAHGPTSTGAGRWFDAIAALCGLRDEVSYDGQAPTELEAAATGVPPALPLAWALSGDEIDLRPAVRAVAAALRAGTPSAEIAARFYATMAELATVVATRFRGVSATVALSGGCFQSRRLTDETRARLESAGFEVLIHRRVPPNDGGIALGQAAVAAFRAQNHRKGGGDVPRHPG
jgi:hydrogenase maturation protein HypF